MDKVAGMSPKDIQRRSRLLENEIRVLKIPPNQRQFLALLVQLIQNSAGKMRNSRPKGRNLSMPRPEQGTT
ncbi:hypothetical protein M758_UG206900 [Ceratodon purpureus]|nr:hypothetical protein M758_UG206900 [Ceratodon purpureus]